MSFAFALLIAQVGPFGTTPMPQKVERPAPRRPAPFAPVTVDRGGRAQSCLSAVATRPDEARDMAMDWATVVKGVQAADAQLCLGMALAKLGQWDQAEAAFTAAQGTAGILQIDRARYGALAGAAALAGGAPDRALPLLDAARADASAVGETAMVGDIAIDRGRALVALGRLDEAAAALAEAREKASSSADAWLLSATLSRRQSKLADAQSQIERAAALLPIDPDIGLEAGVIAVMAGRDDAARKSWQSVVTAAPESPAGGQAKAYLAQLDAGAAQPAKR